MSFEFIEGTEGHKDYIVVAKHHGIIIAFKPVLEEAPHPHTGEPGYVIGARIRMIPGHGVLNLPHTLKTLFPKFPFQKLDEVRGSVFLGTRINTIPTSIPVEDFLMGLRADFIPSLLTPFTYLINECGVAMLHTHEEITHYAEDAYSKFYHEHCELPPHDDSEPISPVNEAVQPAKVTSLDDFKKKKQNATPPNGTTVH